MSLTISTKTYTEYRQQPDAIAYAGPANTISNKDIVELKRVMPKPVGAFAGVARPNVKFVQTQDLGETNVDAIVNVTGSLPVGMTNTAIEDLRDDVVSFLGSAAGLALFQSLAISA